MKLNKLLGMLVICLHFAVAGTAFGADTAPPPGEDERVALAAGLVEYGTEARDGLALLTAAKMYQAASARVLQKGQTGRTGKAIDLGTLFALARQFADDDEHLLALIDQAKESKTGAKGIYYPSCYYEWYCSYSGYCYYKWICY